MSDYNKLSKIERMLLKIEFIEELERLGIEQNPGLGIFCLDFAAYFPYANQDVLDLDASLSTHPMKSGKVLNIRDLGKLNHRYPNQGYATLSQKFGRKLCRCGCLIQRPHTELMEYKYLNLGYGFKGNLDSVQMSVPININTSDERPCATVEARFMLRNPNEPNLALTTYERQPNRCWDSLVYGISNTNFTATEERDRFIQLTPANSEEEVKESGFVVYRETVSPISCRPEDVLII